MKKLLALLFLLVASSSVSAQSLGSDGYWYFAGYAEPYTRTLVSSPGYYSRGCYYPGSSYYSYSIYYAAPVAKVPVYTPSWKEEIVKYAAQRDDHATYLLALKALGINGQQYQFQQGYGYSYNYGVNATTPYGYSYNSIAQLYGDVNLNQLYQQSAQLTAGAQTLASDANNGFQQLVSQQGTNQVRVLEILARGQAGAQVLRALNPNTVSQSTTVFGSAPNGSNLPGPGKDQFPDKDKEQKFLAFQQVVGERCASCHSGDSKKGGFDVSGYMGFTQAQKERVISTLTTNDPTRAMPRSPNGSVGVRLTEAEINLFRIH